MKLIRMFSNDNYKGQRNYLNTQKHYEIMRTALYFAISLSLFVAGWLHTGSRENLLTIVAVLGCLPACKSMVDMIMYLRFKSCPKEAADIITAHENSLDCLFDVVFTSYDKNYAIDHLTVRGNTLCGYTQASSFSEQDFYKHLDAMLKKDGFKDCTIKIFKDIKKYTDRMEQLKELSGDANITAGIIATIKSISL